MFSRLSALTLRTKLVLVLVLFAAVPSLILTGRMLGYYTDDMIKAASQNVHSIVARDNKLIDAQLSRIEDASYTLLTNPKCYEIFRDIPAMKTSDLMNAERILNPEISSQLTLAKFAYQFQLYSESPQWLFGKNGTISLTPAQLERSGIPELAHRRKGAALWLGGADYAQLFGSAYFEDKTYDYQYPVIMARSMDFQYSQNGRHYVLPKEQKRPVLMVFLLESALRETYDGTIGYEGTETFIMNTNGVLVSSNSSRLPVGSTAPEEALPLLGDSGYVRQTLSGQEPSVTIQADRHYRDHCRSVSCIRYQQNSL